MAELGQDWFMGQCFGTLGIGGESDFGMVADGVCTGVSCGNGGAAAFHPFKSVGAWMGCWNAAAR